jgi:uracil-DNA glycosylase
MNKNLNAWIDLLPGETINKMTECLDKVNELRNKGKIIYPPTEETFTALELLHPDDVKVVILGQDPYHQPGQARGLAFAVKPGTVPPPSLLNIYKELTDDIGCDYPKIGNLAQWEHEGVLLLNTTLTVEQGKPTSHANLGWQEVTTEIIKSIMSNGRVTVFLAWGSYAINLINQCAEELKTENVSCPYNYGLKATHPSPLSAHKKTRNAEAFIGSRPFSKANRILTKHGVEPIQWALR